MLCSTVVKVTNQTCLSRGKSIVGLKIYIASKIKHYKRWRELREFEGLNIISSWVDKDIEHEVEYSDEYWIQTAEECIREAAEADLLVFYAEHDETWEGCYMELGAALSHEKPVFILVTTLGLYDELPEFSKILLNHPLVRIGDISGLFEYIKELSANKNP
jgi:hypothetical protein